jgi:hypothetical protein
MPSRCYKCGQFCDTEGIKRHGKDFCSSCADSALFNSPLVGGISGLPVSPSQGAMDALAGVRVAFDIMRTLQSPPPRSLSPGEREAVLDSGYGDIFGPSEDEGLPRGADWRGLSPLARPYHPDYQEPSSVPPEGDVAEELVQETLKKDRER